MDPGRDRPCAVDRRNHRPDRADAGRCHRRCGPLRTAGGRTCGCDHRHQRARIRDVADLCGGGGGGDAACGGELRAGSGHCRHQPRAGRPACDRRAARAQRPLRLARQRNCGGRDGNLRLFVVQPLGLYRHLCAGDPRLARTRPHPRAGGRHRAGARRGRARRRRRHATSILNLVASVRC